MTPDCELLRRYAETRSEESFAELVRRHLDLVYSAALRQVNGDAHLAQDVAQTVFTDLARKAAALARREVLTGWLYTSTHFAAAKAVRTEGRRRAREQEAHTMRELLHDPAPDVKWDKLRSVLDEAMHKLKDRDREAILLRYFEKRPLAEIGAKLGVNENAARMRVERALEKLRAHLVRRGVTTTAAALSAAITVNAVQVAPAGLAVTLAGGSLAAIGTGTALTFLNVMAMTKLKMGIISAIAVAGVATPLVVQHREKQKLRAENQSLRQQAGQLAQLSAENERLSNLMAQARNSFGDDRMSELLRLRGEVGILRRQTNELGRLAEDNRRLRELAANRAQNPPKSEEDPRVEQHRQMVYAKINDAKKLCLGFILHASNNQEQFPTDLDQARLYLKDNPLTETNDFEIVYRGSIRGVTNAMTVLLVRERQAWWSNGKWAKAYGFADGHAEIHSEPDVSSLDQWERERIMTPPIADR